MTIGKVICTEVNVIFFLWSRDLTRLSRLDARLKEAKAYVLDTSMLKGRQTVVKVMSIGLL